MWAILKMLFAPPEDRAEYEPIAADPDAPPLELPVDASGRDVYRCFWALGAGVLLPWNALICTFPLLSTLFPEGALRTNLPSYLSTTFCFANLLFLGVAQRNVGVTSPTIRLRWSLVLLQIGTVIMAVILLPFAFPAMKGSTLLFPLLIVLTLLLALTSSYLQSAVIALAALWGADEMQGVMSGQGGIAVLVSGIQFVLALVDSVRNAESGSGSFLAAEGMWGVGAVWAMCCMGALLYLERHPQFHHVMAVRERREDLSTAKGNRVTKLVLRKNMRLEFAVAFVFVVTLSMFPPITTTITSTRVPTPKLLQPAIFIAFHFLMFNIGDYAGRTYLPSFPPFNNMNIRKIVLASISRVVFLPLFLFCNTPARHDASKFAFPDAVYFIILLALGLTNGAVSTLCMMFASSSTLNPAITEDERDIAGTLAAFSLVSGLAIGSLCSFGVNYVINGSLFGT